MTRFIYFDGGMRGLGGRPDEEPPDLKTLVTKKLSNLVFPEHATDEVRHLLAATLSYVESLPDSENLMLLQDEDEAVLIMILYRDLEYLASSMVDFIDHINHGIDNKTDIDLAPIRYQRNLVRDNKTESEKYYKNMFDLWSIHEMLFLALDHKKAQNE